MSQPAVSVILPSYNRGPELAVSAGSVLAQTFRNIELIIVDDCSTEPLAPYVDALCDPRVRYVRRPRQGGPAAARNSGLSVAKGKYVAFQDSDDEWLLDKLERQLLVLEAQDSETFILSSVARLIGKRVITYRPVGGGSDSRFLSFSDIANRRTTYTQGWLVPRYMLDAVGGFDESIRVWEDYELLLRLGAAYKALATPELVALSVRRSDSVTQDAAQFGVAMCHIIEKHKTLLGKDRALWAKLNYTCGRLLMASAESKPSHSRSYIAASVKIQPQRLAYWKLLLASFVSHKKFGGYLARLNESGR